MIRNCFLLLAKQLQNIICEDGKKIFPMFVEKCHNSPIRLSSGALILAQKRWLIRVFYSCCWCHKSRFSDDSHGDVVVIIIFCFDFYDLTFDELLILFGCSEAHKVYILFHDI